MRHENAATTVAASANSWFSRSESQQGFDATRRATANRPGPGRHPRATARRIVETDDFGLIGSTFVGHEATVAPDSVRWVARRRRPRCWVTRTHPADRFMVRAHLIGIEIAQHSKEHDLGLFHVEHRRDERHCLFAAEAVEGWLVGAVIGCGQTDPRTHSLRGSPAAGSDFDGARRPVGGRSPQKIHRRKSSQSPSNCSIIFATATQTSPARSSPACPDRALRNRTAQRIQFGEEIGDGLLLVASSGRSHNGVEAAAADPSRRPRPRIRAPPRASCSQPAERSDTPSPDLHDANWSDPPGQGPIGGAVGWTRSRRLAVQPVGNGAVGSPAERLVVACRSVRVVPSCSS